jgi:hypothetical protein
MTDDKRKAESRFNQQAIAEAVGRMRPELVAASEGAHKAKSDGDPDFCKQQANSWLDLSSCCGQITRCFDYFFLVVVIMHKT